MRPYAAGAKLGVDTPPALEAIVNTFARGVLAYATATALTKHPRHITKVRLQEALAYMLDCRSDRLQSDSRVSLNPAFVFDGCEDVAGASLG